MRSRQFDTDVQTTSQIVSVGQTPCAETATPEMVGSNRMPHIGPAAAAVPAHVQASDLRRSGGGRLARAGQVLLQLQRWHGNRHVQQILTPPSSVPSARPGLAVQAKLVLGPVDDPYEREADRVAEQVVSHATAPQLTARAGTLLRRSGTEEGPGDAGDGLVGSAAQHAIERARGSGQVIPDAVRTPFERALGVDFSGVRLHADPQADELNRSMRSRAFTTGQDIFLCREEYNLFSRRGQRLLAHELTHVMQQSSDSPAPRVQRVFDFLHNKRKVGIEITESAAGGNRVVEQEPLDAWRNEVNKAGRWTHTVNLPDNGAHAHTWHVAPTGEMDANYFRDRQGKLKWMKWGNVYFTEDTGEVEWIVEHPSQPMGVSEYRQRLDRVNDARTAVHAAMNEVGPGPYFLSSTPNGADHEVVKLSLSTDNNASSQITLESTDREVTRRGLLVGLTHGLDERRANPNRSLELRSVDPEITAVVDTAAVRLHLPAVDTGLVMSYVIADLCHKAVTLKGAGDWDDAYGNFKSWRVLFPKSHPSQILLQSMGALPTITDLDNVKNQFAEHKEGIIEDIIGLLASKLVKGTVRLLYYPDQLRRAGDPGRQLENVMMGGRHAIGKLGVQTDLIRTINRVKEGFLGTEYDHTIDALTDLTGRLQGVVKSSGFASHTGGSKGFAFEDRAEVATTFPELASTYDRLVAMVDHY